MNGLEFIRIRCNMSQSFLAEKLGVTRQAIDLWENRTTPLPAKRLEQLENFFGIDRRYFGVLSESMQQEICALPVYSHTDQSKDYYCFMVHPECCNAQIPCFLPPPPENFEPLTLDEQYAIDSKEYAQILSRAERLPKLEEYTEDKDGMTCSYARLYEILTDILYQLRDQALSGRGFPQHQMLTNIFSALACAFGLIDTSSLHPWPKKYDKHGRIIPNYYDYDWMMKIAKEFRSQLMKQVRAREDELHLPHEFGKDFPEIP